LRRQVTQRALLDFQALLCIAVVAFQLHNALLCPLQIMHVLVALAMWQLHLGADADHRRFSALMDGSLACPGLVAAASMS